MDISGVSPEAAVMAVANARVANTAAEASIAVLARVQRQETETASALVSLIQTSEVKPGVGEHVNAWA
jgi:hypothetical protein